MGEAIIDERGRIVIPTGTGAFSQPEMVSK